MTARQLQQQGAASSKMRVRFLEGELIRYREKIVVLSNKSSEVLATALGFGGWNSSLRTMWPVIRQRPHTSRELVSTCCFFAPRIRLRPRTTAFRCFGPPTVHSFSAFRGQGEELSFLRHPLPCQCWRSTPAPRPSGFLPAGLTEPPPRPVHRSASISRGGGDLNGALFRAQLVSSSRARVVTRW